MANSVLESLKLTNPVATLMIVNTATQNKLHQALVYFCQVLTPGELSAFLQLNTRAPDASSIVQLISEIDKKKATFGIRRLGPCFEPLLQSILRFSDVIGILVSSNPLTAALVWGSVKFVIVFALDYFGYFGKLSAMFRSLGRLCPAFEQLQKIFPESAELRESLLEFYAIVITFCAEALRFLKEKPIAQFGKSLWKPFQARFQDYETQLQEQRKKVDLQIQVASENAKARARLATSVYQQAGGQYRSNQIAQWEDRKRELLLEKISDYDYKPTFSKALSQRCEGTGSWLFDTPEFQLWDQEDQSCGLWCNGIPGSGKTILAAGVVDYLFSRNRGATTSICYFFCEFSKEQSWEVVVILRSLIKQILNVFHDRMPLGLKNHLDMIFLENSYKEPEAKELYQLLMSITQLPTTTYLLIDGLDECRDDNRRQLSFYLSEVIRRSKNRVKVFVSSRPDFDISQSLEGFRRVSLNTLATSPDIELFIHREINQKLENRSLFVRHLDMVEEIKRALIDGSEGMFLWVTFQIHDICRENSDNGIRKVLESLPRGLYATYGRILNRIIADRKPDVAKKIFQWLIVARRTLFLDELVQAVAVESGFPHYNEDNLPTDKSRMLQNCGNLVTYDERDKTVRFAHYTVLEFLLSSHYRLDHDFNIRRSEANLYVGKVCLTYLSLPDFETQISSIPKDPTHDISALDMPVSDWMPSMVEPESYMEWLWKFGRRRLATRNLSAITTRRFLTPKNSRTVPLEPSEILSQKFHLVKYAANEWPFHCSELSQDDKSGWELFRTLVFDRNLPFDHLPWEFPSSNSYDFYYAQQFKWAVENDHVPLLILTVNKLKAEDISVATYIERGIGMAHTYLQIASMKDSKYVLQTLIDLGVNVNAEPAPLGGRTALQAAAGNGNLAILEKLLGSEADVNAGPAFSGGRTALQAAAECGHSAIVNQLLERGADIDAEPAYSEGRTALQAAAGGGHLDIVNRLLKCKPRINVNAEPAPLGGRTALQAAAEGGHLAVVNRLLESEADINAEPVSLSGRTALQAAAEGGYLAIVERLLEHGADINLEPAYLAGRTALQAAAGSGHLHIVERLLRPDLRTDVNAEPADWDGRTALQAAAEGGYLAIVNLLLQSGANVDGGPACWHGRTALQAAAGSGHLDLVDLLLKARANINAEPSSLNRAVSQAAVEGGPLVIMDRLLQSRVNDNAEPTSSGRTALQAAAASGHLDIVDQLLKSGANINAGPASSEGRTSLQAAAGGGHLAVVKRLLQSKADINALPAYEYGRTALQAAAGGGHLDVVEELLRSDPRADVNAKPAPLGGRTALQAAAGGNHHAVVDLLLRSKADVNAEPANWHGRTALQEAAEGGHLTILNRLLQSKADVNAEPASKYGRTALQAAAGGGHFATVDQLLRSKADVNARMVSTGGRTALQAAAAGGHLAVVDRLLQFKADVNAEPELPEGRTALQAAAEGGHLAVVDRLIQLKADVNAKPKTAYGRTALQAAAGSGHLAVVDRLLQSGANVNAEPASLGGRTPLQAAAGGGYLAIVNRLLQSGAAINAEVKSSNGRTALQAAAGGGHLIVVNRLLQFNADVNAKPAPAYGRTALQAAAGGGHLAVVTQLLSEAEINAQPAKWHGRTALQAAAGGGHLAVVNLLLLSGAEANAVPAFNYGRTALQAAAGGGHLAIVDRLLQSKAEVNADPAPKYGRTALQAAAGGGHLAVVDHLLESGAEIHAGSIPKDSRIVGGNHLSVVSRFLLSKADAGANSIPVYGETALQAAISNGHEDVVSFLRKAGATE